MTKLSEIHKNIYYQLFTRYTRRMEENAGLKHADVAAPESELGKGEDHADLPPPPFHGGPPPHFERKIREH